jgi:hypothetical protein
MENACFADRNQYQERTETRKQYSSILDCGLSGQVACHFRMLHDQRTAIIHSQTKIYRILPPGQFLKLLPGPMHNYLPL